jgi:hypothetical protein
MATKRDPDERVSMHGADPKEVLRAMLKIDPNAPTDEVDGQGDDEQGEG